MSAGRDLLASVPAHDRGRFHAGVPAGAQMVFARTLPDTYQDRGFMPIVSFLEGDFLSGAEEFSTLTSWEYAGLRNARNLADGHAYHELPDALGGVVDQLPRLWRTAERYSIPDLENQFREAWSEVAGTPTLRHYGLRICPTASNSIDLVGAACHEMGLRVGLVEPTFDNLALLLRRRGVPLHPIPADQLAAALITETPESVLDPEALDAVFVVNPNNPSGIEYDSRQLPVLSEWCARHGKVLLLDNTFRFQCRRTYDDVAVLRRSGVSFVAIEDTGKSLPTLDLKASPLIFSDDLAPLLNTLYEEVYLCTSGFSLAILTELLQRTAAHGLDATLWALIDDRRARLRAALHGSAITVAPEAIDSTLSVEWLDCSGTGLDDLTATAHLRDALGLHLLPGRPFFWASPPSETTTQRMRASLCKPTAQFDAAISVIQSSLKDVFS